MTTDVDGVGDVDGEEEDEEGLDAEDTAEVAGAIELKV